MAGLSLAFDLLLAAMLIGVAWRCLTAADAFEAVVLFIAFGLLLALAWARLRAPDLALAEAAIGAGLTGALLLRARHRLDDGGGEAPRVASVRAGPLAGACAALVAMVALAAWSLPPGVEGLRGAVAGALPRSGVSHPVTAVLLNFRGYDTLLEVGVLLLALIGVWSVGRAAFRPLPAPGEVQRTMTGVLVPVLIVVAAYLLWVGARAPGGAFQAGALLAAAGVLLSLGSGPPWLLSGRPARILAALGLFVFLGIGVAAMAGGGHLLAYPPAWAGALILTIEAAVMLSIGLILSALYLGGEPPGRGGRDGAEGA